ncbi:MAG: DUF2185 domain-containing protein [Alysiella sp.]|uniref:DUF2185 domain-containing protein n=1 Tax=Alysiella sp. TaxID=1872483 RepID=UPI0026DBBF28|nr:DUF2185 domain-containing protein [Alysiella sp.]MDO4434219.1 DUF2185 domain-containing protein [Alysiella sp.]
MSPTFAQALTSALQYAIASTEITEQKHPIGFAYREAPVFDNDSGWRFFSGNESDEFTDNPDHFHIVPLSAVLEKQSAFSRIVHETQGAWEWNNEAADFIPVADWQPKD